LSESCLILAILLFLIVAHFLQLFFLLSFALTQKKQKVKAGACAS